MWRRTTGVKALVVLTMVLIGCADPVKPSVEPEDGGINSGIDAGGTGGTSGSGGTGGSIDASIDSETDAAVVDSGVDAADVDECSGTNVCTADYPCVNVAPNYTCRGQFPDWQVSSAPSFTVNGTVTDARSGLEWQQTVDANSYTWANAKTYCTGLSLAGTGWRLPSRAELQTIFDASRSNPAIDPTAFPSTPATNFWSSSPFVGLSGDAWYVDFNNGYSNGLDPSNTYRVRCVRSAAVAVSSNGGGGAPPGRYTFPVSGTVYDTRTLLTWQQVVDPGSYTQVAAGTYCTGLSLAGSGWRLPTKAELESIVDDTRFNPPIDPTAFPGTPIEHFWSSSLYVGSSGNAWHVDFYYGYSDGYDPGNTIRVRCVR